MDIKFEIQEEKVQNLSANARSELENQSKNTGTGVTDSMVVQACKKFITTNKATIYQVGPSTISETCGLALA